MISFNLTRIQTSQFVQKVIVLYDRTSINCSNLTKYKFDIRKMNLKLFKNIEDFPLAQKSFNV